jgi:hypothetical protein
MTREDIIKIAKQAGAPNSSESPSFVDFLEAFAKLVAAKEREACAKVCEERWKDSPWFIEAAAAIRARGEAT